MHNALTYFLDCIYCKRFGFFFQSDKRIKLMYLTKGNVKLPMIYEDLGWIIGPIADTEYTVSVFRLALCVFLQY